MFLIVGVEPATVAHFYHRGIPSLIIILSLLISGICYLWQYDKFKLLTSNIGPERTCASFLSLGRGRIVWCTISEPISVELSYCVRITLDYTVINKLLTF